MRFHRDLFLSLFFLFILSACSPSRYASDAARRLVIQTKVLHHAHTGISVYDPLAHTYIYQYNGDKYFVPASNTKIPTLYAALKHLGDSLVGIRYTYGTGAGNEKILLVAPAADPTLLHPGYPSQPVISFLKGAISSGYHIVIADTVWRDAHWGSGWAWSDYTAAYMAEKSSLPVGGNVVQVKQGQAGDSLQLSASLLYFDSLLQAQRVQNMHGLNGRALGENTFTFSTPRQAGIVNIPFVTRGSETAAAVLSAQLQARIRRITFSEELAALQPGLWRTLHSQPLDSVLKPFMHRSDNFFAEQLLLAVSQEMLGYMHTNRVTDTLLAADLAALPQKPRWADGSGLSRYNLFTPQDMVAILDSLRIHFGMERLKNLFATGDEGTLSNYYKELRGSFFAKTGTLSGVVAISGYLFTRKGRLLILSVLVNNHNASATDVRRAVEAFIRQLHNAY